MYLQVLTSEISNIELITFEEGEIMRRQATGYIIYALRGQASLTMIILLRLYALKINLN